MAAVFILALLVGPSVTWYAVPGTFAGLEHSVVRVTYVAVELALVLFNAVVKFKVPEPEALLGVPLLPPTVNALLDVLDIPVTDAV